MPSDVVSLPTLSSRFESRSVTSAAPSGRKAMPHGTASPLASTVTDTSAPPSSLPPELEGDGYGDIFGGDPSSSGGGGPNEQPPRARAATAAQRAARLRPAGRPAKRCVRALTGPSVALPPESHLFPPYFHDRAAGRPAPGRPGAIDAPHDCPAPARLPRSTAPHDCPAPARPPRSTAPHDCPAPARAPTPVPRACSPARPRAGWTPSPAGAFPTAVPRRFVRAARACIIDHMVKIWVAHEFGADLVRAATARDDVLVEVMPAPGEMPSDPGDVVFWVPPFLARPQVTTLTRQMPRLEVIQLLSAGADAWTGRVPDGVTLCDARGVHDSSTAEWVVGAILACVREFPSFARAQERGEWTYRRTDELAGKRVLIVGA